MNEEPRTLPIGKKIERVRNLLGIKQETLADLLSMTQQSVSHIEQQKVIDENLLQQIADAMGVSPDMIRNFDEDKAIYHINHIQNNTNTVTENTFEESSTIIGLIGHQFNPVEKIVELYERLLKSEREKIDILISNKK